MLKKQNSLIGLDIGTHCVKAVELTQYGSDGHANLGMTFNNKHIQSVWVPGTVPTGHFSAYGIYGVVSTAMFKGMKGPLGFLLISVPEVNRKS